MRLLPYIHSDSQLLRLRLNCSRVMSELRNSTGRSFQIVGPETRKLRQPKRDSTCGMTRSPWSADLRRERAVTVCTEMYTSLKYFGHRPREQSETMSAILKMMRCGIGSQCSVSWSVGVMWSKRRMPVTGDCSLYMCFYRSRSSTFVQIQSGKPIHD